MTLRFLVVLALLCSIAGCGLLLDTSPPDEPPDGGVECTTPADCDDALACTADVCADGTCTHDPDDALCESGDICVPTVGCATPCDEASDCDHLDVGVCATGECTFVADGVGYCVQNLDDDVCDDSVACTEDECTTAGTCTSAPSNDFCDDDGVSCTVDECDPMSALQDENGCVQTVDVNVCIDLFACTHDVCAPGNDLAHAATGCVQVPDDAFCAEEGGVCTVGVCVPSLGCQVRVNDEICETFQHCDVVSGACVTIDRTCDEGCDDGNPCNGEETCNDDGVTCERTPGNLACPESGDLCRESFCEPISSTVFACEERLLPVCYEVDPLPAI